MTAINDASSLPNRAGIYALRNTRNGNRYVGRSKRIRERVMTHARRAMNGSDDLIVYRAIRKHGAHSFDVEVLELCEISDLSKREAHWLQALVPKYNSMLTGMNGATELSAAWIAKLSVARRGNTNRKGIPHTPAIRAQISESLKGNNWNAGKKRSAESRARQSATLKAAGHRPSPEAKAKSASVLRGRSLSDETRRKISEAKRGKAQSPDVIRRAAEKRRGLKQSPESQAKRSASLKRWHARKNSAETDISV